MQDVPARPTLLTVRQGGGVGVMEEGFPTESLLATGEDPRVDGVEAGGDVCRFRCIVRQASRVDCFTGKKRAHRWCFVEYLES